MDTESFEASWRLHAAGLRQLVRDLLGDSHAADDVAQETWLAALARPPREGWSWRAWLGGIARHRARDFERSAARRRRHEEQAPTHVDGEQLAPVERFEQIELVVEALRQLSPRNREIVLLRYYEDLAPTAIAERLALPIATVKSRLRRSLAELRRRLEGRAFPAWVWLGGVTMSLKSKTALLVALLVIGTLTGIAWFAMNLHEPSVASEVGDARDLEAVTADVANASTARESTRIDAERPSPAEALSSETSVTDPGIRLEVVERGSLRPVAGATVFFTDDKRVPDDPLAWERQLFEKGRMLERRYAPYAEKLVTDARGTVFLPGSVRRAWIAARFGELTGETHLLETSLSPLRLELEPERVVRVRVVDAAGAPRGGVPVGLRTLSASRVGSCFLLGTTGADGSCEIRGFERRHWEGHSRVGVSFAFPMLDPPFLEVDLQTDPRPSRELVLPPTGRVLVKPLGEDGEPLRAPAFVGLAVSGSADLQGPFDWLAPSTCVESMRGEASFPYVGLGLELTAYLYVLGRVHRLAELRFTGPASEGEAIDASLRSGPRHAALVGIFVDENGAPLQGIYIGAGRVEGPQARPLRSADAFRLEADGRFRYVLDSAPLTDREDRIELVSYWRSGGTDPQRMWSGAIELRGQTYAPGDHDLGQVVLRSSPPLASGIVVSEDGAPLAAELHVERLGNQPGLRSPWESHRAQAFVQKSGEFSIYGRFEAEALRVTARRDGYVQADPVPFVAGETGLRLVMHAAASVEGQVLLDANVPTRKLQLWMRRDSDSLPGQLARLDEQGGFRFTDLRSGIATLRICLAPESGRSDFPSEDADILRLEGLELRAGETCTDARLRPIDLRDGPRTLRIGVADRDGRPLGGVRIAHRPSAQPDVPWSHTTATEGAATILVRSVPAEIHAGKHGYCMIEMPAVSYDVDLVLEPGIAVVIELGEGARAPLEEAELVLSIRGTEQRRFGPDTTMEQIQRIAARQRRTLGLPDPAAVAGRSSCELVLPGPGKYTADLMLSYRDYHATMAEQEFTIEPDAHVPERIRIEVASERLQRVLQYAKRQGR